MISIFLWWKSICLTFAAVQSSDALHFDSSILVWCRHLGNCFIRWIFIWIAAISLWTWPGSNSFHHLPTPLTKANIHQTWRVDFYIPQTGTLGHILPVHFPDHCIRLQIPISYVDQVVQVRSTKGTMKTGCGYGEGCWCSANSTIGRQMKSFTLQFYHLRPLSFYTQPRGESKSVHLNPCFSRIWTLYSFKFKSQNSSWNPKPFPSRIIFVLEEQFTGVILASSLQTHK